MTLQSLPVLPVASEPAVGARKAMAILPEGVIWYQGAAQSG